MLYFFLFVWKLAGFSDISLHFENEEPRDATKKNVETDGNP